MVGRYILQWTVSRVFDLRNLSKIPRFPAVRSQQRMSGPRPLCGLPTLTCSSCNGESLGAAGSTDPSPRRPGRLPGVYACGQRWITQALFSYLGRWWPSHGHGVTATPSPWHRGSPLTNPFEVSHSLPILAGVSRTGGGKWVPEPGKFGFRHGLIQKHSLQPFIVPGAFQEV